MRHLHSESHFCHALYARQDADGYVDALLEMAREQVLCRKPAAPKATNHGFPTIKTRNDAVQKPICWH
jgi:hypothetical protein